MTGRRAANGPRQNSPRILKGKRQPNKAKIKMTMPAAAAAEQQQQQQNTTSNQHREHIE
jgi:hypothetical protein